MSSPAETTKYTYDGLASFRDDGLRRELIDGELVRKRDLYERYGIPEYWYVDLEADRPELYRPTEGRYGRPEILERGDKLTSPRLPGFAAAINDLLQP
jgi:Uma2 family endonuclease